MIERLKYVAAIFVIIVVLTGVFVESAHAYLDPGAGSLILQGLIAGLAAAVVVGKLYWKRLLRFLGLGKSKPAERISEGR